MKEKRNIHELIVKEEPHLHEILDPAQVAKFKELTNELRDTWTKKQMFRTKTEMEFSVLNDAKYPTNAAKYWQCVREQSTYLDNLMALSFDYRRNDAKIKWLENKIKKEQDEYKLTKHQIDLDEAKFGKASMEKVARHRMREIKMWSKLKKEFDDGSFDTQDVNRHQLESYGLQYHEKAKTLNANSSEAEIFNVMGQLQSLQRIKKSGELESSYKEKEQITQHGKPKD